jgi:LAS superfamily LD-carboxypeptidase LdcB
MAFETRKSVDARTAHVGGEPLVPLSFAPGFALAARAAEAAESAVRESAAPRVTSAYRSLAEQERLYALYLAGRGNLAAKPGTSWHERGRALDARGTPEWETAMRRHGWTRTVTSEPWHWEYRL